MWSFLGRRLLSALPTLFGTSFIAFVLIRMVPGDPVLMMLGERGGSPEAVAEMRASLGLDQPFITQYLQFLGHAVQGDLGHSIISRRPVFEEFVDRFKATAELSLAGMFFAVCLGIPLGLFAATRRNSWLDHSLMGASLVGYSMPIFWWGLLLILFFSIGLGWTPVSGRMSLLYDVPARTGFMVIDIVLSGQGWPALKEALRHLALPALALGTVPLAAIARMTRSSLLEVLGEDYIRTARAKGLTAGRVVWHHALRNALIPIITIVGLMVGSLLTGAILTETIFSWPGIGKWIVASVIARDYPVIQGGLLLISALVVSVNIAVDAAYHWVNPMLRGQ